MSDENNATREAFDFIHEDGMFKKIIVSYNLTTGEAKIKEKIDISEKKYRVAHEATKMIAQRLMKL